MLNLQNNSVKKSTATSAWLLAAIAIVLAAGIFFRFANLDHKIYWHDETISSLRLSGYTRSELIRNAFSGQRVSVEQLQTYQQLKPGSSLKDVIASLAAESPQHPPLYYTIARFGVEWFGSSATVTRGVAAVISLLIFPCAYWLCLELFQSPRVGWLAIVLLAVSPLQVLYAQEARQYSLWATLILLSSAALLRAMRLSTMLNWAIYAGTLSLAFYTFPFSALVAIAHGVYVLVMERFRLSRGAIAYGLASLAAVLSFVPWIAVVFNRLTELKESSEWAALPDSGVSYLAKRWAANLFQLFFAWDLRESLSRSYLLPLGILVIGLVILVAYAFYVLCRHAPQRSWLFVLLLTGVPSVALVVPDLVLGTYRSGVIRYIIPVCLGIQLAISFLLAHKTLLLASPARQRQGWTLLTGLLIFAGLVSCAWMNQASIWWTKGSASYDNLEMAQSINSVDGPLVLLGFGFSSTEALSFSHLLNPSVQMQKLVKQEAPEGDGAFPQRGNRVVFPTIDGFKHVFLIDYTHKNAPIKQFLQAQRFKITPLFERKQKFLWKIEKGNP